jgi:hypothetical protein
MRPTCRMRVLIGSANLTEPAYRRNQELMAALDFGPNGNLPPELLSQCVIFLNRVRSFAPGSGRVEGGPQAALEAFLLTFLQTQRYVLRRECCSEGDWLSTKMETGLRRRWTSQNPAAQIETEPRHRSQGSKALIARPFS